MRVLLLAVLCAAAVGCGSLGGSIMSIGHAYKPVPQDELRQAAALIEQAVAAGERQPALADLPGLLISSPEIQQAIRTRAARIAILSGFLDSGHAWERKDSQLWVIRSAEYKRFGTGRDRDRHALMVASEASDRWMLYEGIIKANDFAPKDLGIIQSIFFEERIKVMKPGQKYEGPDGAETAVAGL